MTDVVEVGDFSFDTVDVKAEIQKMLKQSLPKFGFEKVKVIKADPQTPAEIPCVGINRADDSEATDTIADFVGSQYNNDEGKNYSVFGSYFNETLEVRVWHSNADSRDKLYRHVKAILFAGRHVLTEKGLLNIKLRSGKDEQDSSMSNAPMVLYWASITMTYLNPLNVEVSEVSSVITAIGALINQPNEDNEGGS